MRRKTQPLVLKWMIKVCRGGKAAGRAVPGSQKTDETTKVCLGTLPGHVPQLS